MAQRAVAMDDGGSAELVLVADRALRFLEQSRGILRRDPLQLLCRGTRFLALVGELAGCVVGPDDQAGDKVARVADPGNVPPGIGRVGGVHADRIAVTATDRFAILSPLLRAALVA